MRSTEKSKAAKVAVVTGAAHGIGKAIAQQLWTEGFRVVLSDIDQKAGERVVRNMRPGTRASFCRADVGSEADVQALAIHAKSVYGRIDLLVNNAAIANPHEAPVEQLLLSDWEKYLRVNLTSVFLCTKYMTPLLRRSKGVIINVASTRALMSEPHSEAYAACKGGVVALTHASAISLGPDVRVHCISPGWIETKNSKLRKKDHLQHPVGRVGKPDDVAQLVSFLASSKAGFMTGNNTVIDGGMVRKMIYES